MNELALILVVGVASLVPAAAAGYMVLSRSRRTTPAASSVPACETCRVPMEAYTLAPKRALAVDTWMLRLSNPTHWRCPRCKAKRPYDEASATGT